MCLATQKTFGAQSIIDQKSKSELTLPKPLIRTKYKKKNQLLKQSFYPAVGSINTVQLEFLAIEVATQQTFVGLQDRS